MSANEDKRDKLKRELDDMLNGFQKTFGLDEDHTQNVIDKKLAAIQSAESMVDFEQLNPQFKRQATDVISDMYKFYLNMDIIDKSDYLDRKKELLSLDLANIFFQLKTVKTVIERVTEEITAGNTNTKLIDSFTHLQDKFSGIIRSHANYILFMEDAIRKMQGQEAIGQGSDNQVKKSLKEAEDYYMVADQKKLVEEINDIEPDEKVEKKNPGSKLTDPTGKADLMEELDIDKDLVNTDEEDISDYEGLIDTLF